jgi:phosphate transport system permease protein
VSFAGTPAGTSSGVPPRSSAERPRRKRSAVTALRAHGESFLWLTAGGLAASLMMILGLLALVFVQGVGTFWPVPVVRIEAADLGPVMGEVTREEWFRPASAVLDALPDEIRGRAHEVLAVGEGQSRRRLVRIGNFERTGEHFRWVNDFTTVAESRPPWAMVLERRTWGRFYGELSAYVFDGEAVATDPPAVWERFRASLGEVKDRWEERRGLEVHDIGVVNRRLEGARLAVRSAELRHGRDSPEHRAATESFAVVEEVATAEFDGIRARIAALDAENAKHARVLRTADGSEATIAMADIVRGYPPNSIGLAGSVGVYLSRWWEFLVAEPREANSEGGVFPAIFGTVAMTLLMSIMVTPFGVLAALYLREYARAGVIISAVRIAINNLAGVPSIVFGVFGLGFFCYIVGASIDELLYAEKLPTPTFGTGGILWASLTLALLTLPVVIVATEEALAAVPNSMREGSYACGASKWQTIQRIVLPRAMPGILTGMILAIARGAGEVAPLMLVGAVKLAPELPIDATAPFIHLERSFMHLGFHIYDVGFQSQNSEAAKPMVYTTTLLLIAIIATLNLSAIWLRARLRRRFVTSQF